MNISSDPATADAKPLSTWALLRPYVFDIVGPFVAYFIVQAFGAPGTWAMTAAGIAAALSAFVNSYRKKGIDALGVLILIEIAVSLALNLFVNDTRFALVRPSFYTGAAALYIGASAFSRQPLTFIGSRTMVARRGPMRIAAYERAWLNSAEFRNTHRFMSLAIGVGLAVDSLLRVYIVFHYPVARASWLSNVPHLTAMVLIIIASAFAGRRFSRLVDQHA